jgi:uncharacterized FlaG/YvyC family protein
MEATFLLKNTLDAHDGIWITGIICFTILLLTISVLVFVYYRKDAIQTAKEKEMEKKEEEEKAQRDHQLNVEEIKTKDKYRERLANFFELRAKGITKDENAFFTYNDHISTNYVKVLNSFINGTALTEDILNFTQKEETSDSKNTRQ